MNIQLRTLLGAVIHEQEYEAALLPRVFQFDGKYYVRAGVSNERALYIEDQAPVTLEASSPKDGSK